jgi:hypothetical protein
MSIGGTQVTFRRPTSGRRRSVLDSRRARAVSSPMDAAPGSRSRRSFRRQVVAISPARWPRWSAPYRPRRPATPRQSGACHSSTRPRSPPPGHVDRRGPVLAAARLAQGKPRERGSGRSTCGSRWAGWRSAEALRGRRDRVTSTSCQDRGHDLERRLVRKLRQRLVRRSRRRARMRRSSCKTAWMTCSW